MSFDVKPTKLPKPGKLTYVEGDATDPIGPGPKIIAHICNDAGGWGAGFVLALSAKWDSPEQMYRSWAKDESDSGLKIGRIQIVRVTKPEEEPPLWVANMVAQVLGWQHGLPPIRYGALDACLFDLAKFAVERNASVHMPRIGAGLAGGRWSEIKKYINDRVVEAGVDVTVYDLPGSKFNE